MALKHTRISKVRAVISSFLLIVRLAITALEALAVVLGAGAVGTLATQ